MALISVFSSQGDTRLYCQTTDTGLVHRAVACIRKTLTAPTRKGTARLS